MTTKNAEFTLTRTFNAPRTKVWKAWTDRELLQQWFGPKGCPIVSSQLELKVGGMYLYSMQMPDGSQMWGRWTFSEINEPSRLAWQHNFSDPEGKTITRHPYSPTWPLHMTTTVDFEEVDGKTQITVTMGAVDTTPEERETFDAGMEGMSQGWGGTFDQLEEFLAK